jgi:UDP-glucose 4-epimerase
MRVLVTGGAGFIGSHVVESYVDAGCEVLVLDDLSKGRSEFVHPQADLEVVDLCDHATVAKLVEGFRPKLINHHAAQIDIRRSVADPVLDARINVVATINLLQCAVRADVEGVLFASSGGSIYGETPDPVDETAPKAPTSPYAAAKAAVEGYLFAQTRTFGLPSISLRYGNVYGPRQNPKGEAGVVAIFSLAMLGEAAPAVYGTGEQLRDYVFVDDVAQANQKATERLLGAAGRSAPNSPDDNAYNIGSGASITVNALFREIRQIVGYQGSARHEAARPGELLQSRLVVEKAERELGFRARTPLADGLRQTVEWIATHPQPG